MRTVTFKIYEDLLEKLDTYARLKGLPRSEVIRRAIIEYLERRSIEVEVKPKIIKILG